MQIRRATVKDAADLAEQMKLVADEGEWLATQRDRSVDQLTEMFRSGLTGGDILFALEDGRRIVGAIGIHPTEISGVHSLGMWIVDGYRGEGWGRRLVNEALDAARELGVRKVVLEVFPENARAIALYAKCGFEIEGYKRDHYQRLDGSIRSSVMMARFLGSE
jgi:putative acetyltransferase